MNEIVELQQKGRLSVNNVIWKRVTSPFVLKYGIRITYSKGEKMVIEFLYWGESLLETVSNCSKFCKLSVANNGKSYWSYCKGATEHVC